MTNNNSLVFLTLASIVILASFVHYSNVENRTRGIQQNKRKLAPFVDIFPDKSLVVDVGQLSRDIATVDDEGDFDPPASITNPKFKFVSWIQAEKVTEIMIVKSQEEDDNDDGDSESSSSMVVVIFRGTEDTDDWIADAKIIKDPSKFVNAPDDVKIHRGFQNALFDEDIMGQVEAKVIELVGEEGEVFITGHSLGGSKAHIAATYLADKYPTMKATMINFGAPRFGNEAYKKWSESLSNLSAWRYVNDYDAIPRFIPNIFGFDHAGHLFQIWHGDYAEVFYRQTGDGENYAAAPWYWYYGASASDHYMINYLKQFNDHIDSSEFWPEHFVEKSLWHQVQQLWYYYPKRQYWNVSEE